MTLTNGVPSTTSVGTTGLFTNQDINGLLIGGKWLGSTLTYSFPTAASNYGSGYGSGEPNNNFQTLTTSQQNVVRYALGLVSQYTNLQFQEITETDTTHALIRVANSDTPATSWGYYPSEYAEGGDVWLGLASGLTPTKGSYDFVTIMHELGHALGLKHGQDTSVYGPLPASHNSTEWSLMTYMSYIGSPGQYYTVANGSGVQTYMADDIAALQYLYGANFNTNAGATTYTWSPATGEMFINGVGQGASTANKIFETVWDGNGNDTYDLSNYSTPVYVNLNPGEWSSFSSVDQRANLDSSRPSLVANGTVLNAYEYNGDARSLIENAKGGAGNDTLVGNVGDNVLSGGGGDDTIDGGGAGNDVLDGGSGTNTLTFVSATHGVTVSLAAQGTPQNTNVGIDTLTNFQNLTGSNYNDFLQAAPGVNIIMAGDGDDIVDAGDPDGDVIDGGTGINTISFASATHGVTAKVSNYSQQLTYPTGGASGSLGTDGLIGFRNIIGSNYDDVLTGDKNVNVISGGAGNDTLYGGSALSPTNPQNLADTLTGGSGADTFIIAKGEFGNVIVTDFSHAEGDRIDLKDFGSAPTSTLRKFDLLLPMMTQSGADTDINFYGIAHLYLKNVAASSLTASDFIFAPQHLPTTALPNQTIAAGATVNIGALVNYADAEGSPAMGYRFWDDGSTATSGYISDITNAHEASGAVIYIGYSDIGSVVLHAGTANGTEQFWVQAFDGTDWGAWQGFTLTTTGVNRAPTTSLADQTLAAGGSVNLAGLIGYADADGNPAVSYRFWDDGAGASTGYISDTANAHEAAGAAFTVAASDIANAVLHAGSAAGVEGMWVQAFDGTDWSPWQRFTLTTTGVNHAPTTSLADQTLAAGATVNLSTIVNYADADSDAAVSYRFWDDGGGASTGYISDTANAHEASGAAFTISWTDIGNAVLHAGSAAGAEVMWVQAFDGTDWSPWQRFTLTTTGVNHAPTTSLADQTLAAGATVNLAGLIHFADADNDAAVSYRFWDDGGGATTGYISDTANAHEASGAAFTIAASDIGNAVLHAGSAAGAEGMWVQAFDGTDWSPWQRFTLTTTGVNHAPTTSLADQTLAVGGSVNLAGLIGYADADSDAAVSYRFWDDGGGATTGYISDTANAHEASGAAFTIAASDIGNAVLHAGSAAGAEGMWVQAFDGTAWSPWQRFTLTTTGVNHAPTVSIANHTVAANSATALSSWLTYADADNDIATQYQLWDDGSAASSGYVSDSANAHEAAGATITVAASDFANIMVHGGAAAGGDTLWVRAFDGHDWSNWAQFQLLTA